GNLPAQTVAADQEGVAFLYAVRTFHIHLNGLLRTQRANDDVGRDALQLLGADPLPPGQLPHQAVVEGELLDGVAADPVDAAVADVPDPGALRVNQQGGAGGPHPLEAAVLLAAVVDGEVRLDKSFVQRLRRSVLGVLGVDVRHGVRRQLAGQLADRVRTHA